MQNSSRTRRTKAKQTGSSIPVRVSNNEQTRRTVHNVRSDGQDSGGEFSSAGNSGNVETTRAVHSVRSDGSGGEFSSTGNLGNVETTRTVHNAHSDRSGRGYSSTGNSDNVETSRTTVHSARSDGSGRGYSSTSNCSSNDMETENMICTSRSDVSDGESTTVRQTFRIVGTIDKDNRCSMESLDSNKDSAFHGSQDFICQEDNDSDYSEVKLNKTVSFEDVGSNDVKLWMKPSDDIKVELEEEVGEDEELLKEELLRIFDRERFTLGTFFKNKMQDLARDCRKRELELHEHSRGEIAEIENEVAQEKSDMQKVFADEIAALTRTFNEDRANMEQYYKEQIKELREQFENDQKEREQKYARENIELQEKLESDFQAMLRAEITETKQSSIMELAGREEKFSTEKVEIERRHSVQLCDAEINTKKVKDELEMMFTQEKARLEKDLVERIKNLEQQVYQERETRVQLATLLEEEKVNVTNLDRTKRSETEKLKSEFEVLRVEFDEKNKVAMEMTKIEEEIRVNGKNGLNGKLREDFDRMIEEHKEELERKYLTEKEELHRDQERQVQEEKKKIQDDVENERKKMKEDMEKERRESVGGSNGHWEGMAQNQDDSLRRNSEYSASTTYGDQEQRKVSVYKVDQSLHRGVQFGQDNSTERPEYNASTTYNDQEQRKVSVYKVDHSLHRGVWQFGHEDNGQKDDHGSYTNPRDDGRYEGVNVDQLSRENGRKDGPTINSREDGPCGDRGIQEYNTRDNKGYSNQLQEPKTDQPQYLDSNNRNTTIDITTTTLKQRPEQHQSQYNGEFYSGRPSQDSQQEPRSSQYNSYNRRDEDVSEPLPQEQRGSQYNPYNREDGRHPSPPSHGEQPEHTTSYQSKDQGPSSTDPKSELFYVTPGNENSLRSEMNELRQENEGLKAKIDAMEENIDLHKKYKAEAKEELGRLQNTKDELESKLNDSGKDEEAKKTKGKVDKLEKSLRESEKRRKEFEVKVRELNNKLGGAEKKAEQAKEKANDLEDKIRGHSAEKSDEKGSYGGKDRYSRDSAREKPTTSDSSPQYQDPSRSDQYDKEPDVYSSSIKFSDGKRPEPSRSERYDKEPDTCTYPSSIKLSDGKRPDPSRSDRYGKDAGTTYPRSIKYEDDMYHDLKSSDRYGKEPDSYPSSTKYEEGKREDPSRSDRYGKHDSYPSSTKHSDGKHENVYGYPAELGQSFDVRDYKTPHESTTTTRHTSKDKPQQSWKNPDSRKGKCTKCSAYCSKSKATTRPDMSSSPHLINGSHDRLGKGADKQVERYKPGRYSSFGGANDPGFNTSSPRKLEGRGYDNDGMAVPNGDKKEIYEKTVAERDKLVQLIKELKDKVDELYAEKERIHKEQSTLIKDPTAYSSVGNGVPYDQSDLKSQVEEMQRKIRTLAERLKRDGPPKTLSAYDNGSCRTKPSMQYIEDLQDKLHRTGEAINHTNQTLDPDALRRIEKEIKTVGELIKSHFSEEEQGGQSTYRSEDAARVQQLQMDKQELEMKLNMARDVMNDYVNRLSEKMENLGGANALSDATLQELYERNAKLKETLKALEKGQKRSVVQNEQLMNQKSALQNVIGRICQSEDASFCSQYSTPRQSGNCCHDGSYGYTMTSHGQCNVPELDLSDRFSCY